MGPVVTESLIRAIAGEVTAELERGAHPHAEHLQDARKIFEEVALSETFVDFLTLPAYELIN